MSDKELLDGIENFNLDQERKLSLPDRVLSEAVQLHRIVNSNLVDEDVKQLLSNMRARLAQIQLDMRGGELK